MSAVEVKLNINFRVEGADLKKVLGCVIGIKQIIRSYLSLSPEIGVN